MKTIHLALVSVLMISVTTAAQATTQWVEGTNYTVLPRPQPTTVAAGKVEVMEQIKRNLPASAQKVMWG